MKWLNNPKPRGNRTHRVFGIGPPALGHPGSRLIHPNSIFAQCITGLSSALLIYVAVVTPVVVGFFWEREPCDPIPTLEFDMFVDCVFVCEIILNFFIGVYHQGVYRDDIDFVAWTYVTNNFAFDIITSIPVAVVEYATIQQCKSQQDADADFNPNNLRIVRIVKPLRIFKLLRIMKATKIINLLDKLESIIRPPPVSTRILRLLMSILLIVHICACIYWLVKLVFSDDSDMVDFLDYHDLPTAVHGALWERYLLAMYFISTIFTTVGFGDISAINSAERLYGTPPTPLPSSFFLRTS